MNFFNKKNENLTIALFCLFLSFSLFNCSNAVQDGSNYPNKPITLIVPWAPGGMTDISSRILGAVLQEKLGQPVNVVNRTGGGGVVGHLALAQAKPDGYTLGAVTVEITLLHHQGLTELTSNDFTPLTLTINNPAAITVKADAPWDSLPDLIKAIKANPGSIQASGTGKGAIWDLARLGFLNALGLKDKDMPWVPSQGAAPALQELLAGGVEVVTASLTEVDALRKSGQVKCLGVMADQRLEQFPEVPTLKEQGVDWSIGGWVSLCAPKGLDPVVQSKLDSVVRVVTASPEFINGLKGAGNHIDPKAGEALSSFFASQDRINGQLLEQSKQD